jgi:transposase
MGTDLSDAQWELIRPLLPTAKPTGRPRADERRTRNGILYVLRTGCRRKDLPDRYGSSVTGWRAWTNGKWMGWHLGEGLEGLPGLSGRSREAGLEPSLFGWQLCTG